MNANWDTMRLKMIANKYVNASRNQKKKSHECTKKERNTHKTNRIESNRKVPSFWPLSLSCTCPLTLAKRNLNA